MRAFLVLGICLIGGGLRAADPEDLLEWADTNLTIGAFQNTLRARLSGTIDLEFYHFEQPAPGLIDSKADNLFNPRLTLFLDAQMGDQVYFFAQTRVDRGFDPSLRGAQVRLDEYALRYTPWNDGRFTLQIGKFATVVGNWVPRHLSWDNPFVNAPLSYENVTPINDKEPPKSPLDFTTRFHHEKYEFLPIIWGPSYATGLSTSGRLGQFDYAAELKNASLSSRPQSWSVTEVGFEHPTISARFGLRPNQIWNIGVSISDGPYLRTEAGSTLPRDHDIDDYNELVVGQDISFAWHHWQLWAEFYEARFEVPRVGDADTFAYYLEAKYKFSPQLFGALRWNQQLFDDVRVKACDRQWANDLGRIDLAVGYRFTPHAQLKLQYSWQQETSGSGNQNHIFAAQFTVRF